MACVGNDTPCAIAGDDFFYNVTYTDNEDNPIDLTGATAKMDLRDSVTNATVVQSMNGGIIDAVNGQMRFELDDNETASLLPRTELSRDLVFSVKLFYADSTEQTILTGVLSINQVATE